MGNLKGAHADVKAHPFFKDVDFDAVVSRNYHVPEAWVPAVNDVTDTSNFDTSQEEHVEPQPYHDLNEAWLQEWSK